jgi:hypothetical protein
MMIPPAQLLDAWDHGQAAASLPARALALLPLADPNADPILLPVGAVNARLLALRERLFGPQLTCVAACPHCGERLELGFTVGDLSGSAVPPPAEVEVPDGGRARRFRLPSWVDLAAVAAPRRGDDPREMLLERCQLEPEGGAPFSPALLEAAAAALEEADPLAEVLIAIGCSGCEGQFEARFDIVEHLWAEVDARSHRLLGEIHALAVAYGWREADVLALSPARRRVYLEMAAGK